MFIPCTQESVGYVLTTDREHDPPTIFWIRPMDAEEYQVYMARWEREDRRVTPDESRAKKKVAVDREQFQAICSKVENAWAPGDSVTDQLGIARIAQALDWSNLQEIIRSAASTSALRPFQKNSSGFSSNGAPPASDTRSRESASSPTANAPMGSPATTTEADAQPTPI